MFIPLKSEKWSPLRDDWFEMHGTKSTTFIFGLFTVLMMPVMFWIVRRGENVIQFLFGVRTLAKFPSTDDPSRQNEHFLESIVVIHEQSQISCYHKGLAQKIKIFLGLVLSKIYLLVLFCWVYGFDQIGSKGFSCRNLKDGTGFLLSNNTKLRV